MQLISANAKEMICSLKFSIRNHYWRKCLSNLLHIERCSVMFNAISDIMVHWYAICNTIIFAFNFYNATKTIHALMFIISNHWRICHSNLLHLEQCNWCDFLNNGSLIAKCNSIIFAFNFCNAIQTNCALMFIMSNNHGRNSLLL